MSALSLHIESTDSMIGMD